MIGISKLYCGTVEPSDALRYGRHSGSLPSHLLQFSADKKPVVVWNMTKACNLRCQHCYAQATAGPSPTELSTGQARAMIDDLAGFGAPVILFSGGEPLMRPDLPELARYAVGKGMRAVISTNGTLITADKAQELKDIGLSYVGVSLDGLPAVRLAEGPEAVTQGPVPLVSRQLELLVRGWIRCELDGMTDLATVRTRLQQDVETAILTDPTRGGLAVDTWLTGARALEDPEPDQLAALEVTFLVLYRTRYNDPTSGL
mgnify:CR=1 FL=1